VRPTHSCGSTVSPEVFRQRLEISRHGRISTRHWVATRCGDRNKRTGQQAVLIKASSAALAQKHFLQSRRNGNALDPSSLGRWVQTYVALLEQSPSGAAGCAAMEALGEIIRMAGPDSPLTEVCERALVTSLGIPTQHDHFGSGPVGALRFGTRRALDPVVRH